MSAILSIRQIVLPRTVAVTLSLLLHGLLFVGFGGVPSTPSPEQVNPSVTRLSFLAPAPKAVPAPEEIAKKEPEKVEPKKVEQVKRPEAKRVAKAKPEKVKSEPELKQESVVPQQMVAAASEASPQVNEGMIKRQKERYLAAVMAHIEAHKWYPKAARRRGIEGEVHVRFVLQPDGTARDLQVESGPSLLIAAAKQAVERAVPMPKPPKNVHCPIECEFRMRYALDAT